MTPRETWRDHWRRAVLQHNGAGDPRRKLSSRVKLLCVVLCDDMNPDGTVSVPRDRLAFKLGVSAKTISIWFEEAAGAGVLERLVKPAKGRTSVWIARRPASQVSRERRRSNERGKYVGTPTARQRGNHVSDNSRGNHGGSPSGRRAERIGVPTGFSPLSTEPQQSDVKAADAKAAQAAGHPSTSSSDLSSSRSPSGEPPKAGPSSTEGDEYEAARRLLDQLDRSDRNHCRARAVAALGYDAGEKALAKHAADIARAEIGEVA